MLFFMVDNRVTTSIKIDPEKRELVKKRGLILSDVLDQALDIALGIELKESTNLVNDKEELEQNLTLLKTEKDKFLKQNKKQIESLENEKDKTINNYINDYEKQVKSLEKEKDKFLKNYLKNHEDKLLELENEKNQYLKDYDTKISEIDFKIKNIEKALESAVIEDQEEVKQKDYKYLLRLAYKHGGALESLEQREALDNFVEKYKISTDDYRELLNKLEDDLNQEYYYRATGSGKSVL